jgi:hypothetical protein
MSLRPSAQERRGIDPVYVANYAVTFEVSCERCRVEYGKESELLLDEVEGAWTGAVHLGAVRDGSRVPVVVRAQPIGETLVRVARILINGEPVASRENDEPGKRVNVRARIGG